MSMATGRLRAARLPGWRAAAAALVSVSLIVSGLVLIGQGLWIPAKAALAQILLDRAFVRSLENGDAVRPWPWADIHPVARIALPSLGESYVALSGSSGQALAFGPGHVEGSKQAGDPGTAVYAAHRDTQFASLGRLKPGDPITVTRRDGVIVRFRVTGSRVARWDAAGIDADAPGRHLVLATCWPLDAVIQGPDRFLVEAEAQP